MFILVSKITITQVSKAPNVGRTKTFTFNYVQDIEITSTWAHLTDTAKVVLPRKIFYKNEFGQKQSWATNQDIYGNPNKKPLIMRGDKIKIECGYFYFSGAGRILTKKMNTEFEGFITSIENKMPIVLHCEDKMYQLKQTQVPDKVWDGRVYTIETMLQEMLLSNPDNVGIKVLVDNFQHKTGDFITKGVTMAQVLDELRRNYHLESYIRVNATTGVTELRCGIIRYYPGDRVNHIFHFQKNIASDSLTYTRDTDVRIGVKAVSINKVKLTATNSAGKFKTSSKRLEVNAGDQDGEIRTLFFPDIEDPAELKKQAEICLPYLKYEGFRGTFQSFGLPFVKHGDSTELHDAIITERKGTYLVKEVKTKFGVSGYRRTLGIDIRIDGLSAGELLKFQNFGL